MCIFVAPVQGVSDTKIAVAPLKAQRQLTVYQNKAVTLGRNAMVLPVPAGAEIQLIDLSSYGNDFWTDCEKYFPQQQDQNFGWGAAAGGFGTFGAEAPPLPVHQVGSYRCSIVPTLADLGRIDRSVFSLVPHVVKTLDEHYATGFSFIVCLFEGTVDGHPIAYISAALPGGKLFIPTRHDHGDDAGAGAAGPVIHQDVHCDGCKTMHIRGSRFKCLVCNDFDYCAACYSNSNNDHDTTHVFGEYKRKMKTWGQQLPVPGTKDARAEYDHIIYIFGAQLLCMPNLYTSKRDHFDNQQRRQYVQWARIGGYHLGVRPAYAERVVIKGAYPNCDYYAGVVE